MLYTIKIMKTIFLHFKNPFYSRLATGRDTENLRVEVSPFSHVVLPTGRSFLVTVLFLRSSLPVGLKPEHVLRNIFLYLLFLGVFSDQFWVVYINTINYRFCMHSCISTFVNTTNLFSDHKQFCLVFRL